MLAPLASASTHVKAQKSKSKGGSSSTSSLSTLESQLAKFQKLAHSGDTVSETGSTLFYPLFVAWSGVKPLGLSISPAGTGSGTGQAQAEAGTINIGASDAYLPQSIPSNVLNIPIVVSAQQIDYDIPGLSSSTHVKLNANVLNDIYSGKVTNWDNSEITSINKGIKLPNLTIVPLRTRRRQRRHLPVHLVHRLRGDQRWVRAGQHGRPEHLLDELPDRVGRAGRDR